MGDVFKVYQPMEEEEKLQRNECNKSDVAIGTVPRTMDNQMVH